MSKPEVISIDGVNYVREGDKPAKDLDGMKYCVVRTYSAGVHIGYVKEFATKHQPQYARLINSRRLHQWSGAASLSQVAMDGVSVNSRIAMEIPEIELTDVIEVIPCSSKAAEYFKGVKVWKK